ncbi:MAG: nitrilase-related carbon-nitrogen hydrolase [Candidatus Azotimanducaceae bacterium]|nr:nitrilase [Gammaproteobacteria bacterium]OUV68025.1 MAG: nitrilase [Gammaproteobacteria bacterium TMED133]
MTLFYAAACQTDFPAAKSRTEISSRVDRMCEIIEQTITGYEPFFDVRLLAFPEFAHTIPVYDNVEEIYKKLAVEIPNEHTERYVTLARQLGCFIQTGSFLEFDKAYPGHIFNTTVLIGPTGILTKYRKINPWIPWEVHSSPHDIPGYSEDIFPVAETELGKIAVATCYDWLFPETIREMTFRGAEIMIRISAYMDPWGSSEPMNWWTLVNRTRALENMTYVVASNQGAEMSNYPPFSWPGGSMIVDYDGRILAQADPGPGEKVVVAPINIQALRNERERRLGHDTITHSRSSLYTYLASERLKPAREDINIKSLKDRIRNAKQKGSQ